MKRFVLLTAFGTLTFPTFAEPVKWANGRVEEATILVFQPSSVELRINNRTEKVALKDLDPEWIKAKFPDEDLVALQRKAQALVDSVKKNDPPFDYEKLPATLESLATRIKILEEENAKLRAELKQQQRK